ncbi:Phenylalanine--tRNA ligase beta subunit [compost metagenome]
MQPDGRVEEPRWLSFLVTGEQATGVWKHAPEALTADFFWAKGIVERLFAALGLAGLSAEATQDEPVLHPGRAARLSLGDRFVGIVGEIHPEVAAAYDLPVGSRAALATLSLDALEALVSTEPRPYAVFGRYPAILRDLALVVPQDLPAASVVSQVRSMAGGVLESVEVFDRYQGPQVPEGKVSLGLRLRYRVAERTLSDDEIEPIHRGIVQSAEEAFGAAVRDK